MPKCCLFQFSTFTWRYSIFHIWGRHVGVQVLTKNTESDFRGTNEKEAVLNLRLKIPSKTHKTLSNLSQHCQSIMFRTLSKTAIFRENISGWARSWNASGRKAWPGIFAANWGTGSIQLSCFGHQLLYQRAVKASKSLESFNFFIWYRVLLQMFKESKYRTNMLWLERFDIL